MGIFMLNFLLYGIGILVNYSTISHCFFNNCYTDVTSFYVKFFEDRKVKILFGINIALLIILKYVYLRSVRVFDLMDDATRITPSAYTVLVGNVKRTETVQDLITFFEVKVPNSKVAKVNLLYDIKDFYKIIQQWMLLERQITILDRKGEKNSNKYQSLIKERHKVKEYFYELKSTFTNPKTFKDHFTGYAFVTFTDQNDMHRVLNSLNFTFLGVKLPKTRYKVRRAPEPVDVVWENFGLTFWQKMYRRAIALIVSGLIICISFGIILGFKLLQENIDNDNTSVITFYAISVLITFVVIIINFILRKVLRLFTQLERRTTYTAIESEIVFKISIAYFINTAIVVLLVNKIVLKREIWGPRGVIANIITIQIISIFSDSLYYMFNPYYIINKIRKSLLKREVLSSRKNKVLQCELNQAYEGMTFDIAERYYMCFKTISVAFFFQTVMPYLLLFAVVEFFITYWTQKYVLIHRSMRTRDIDFKFTLKTIKMVELMILLLALGYLTFERIVMGKTSAFTIVFVCIGGFEYLIMQISVITALFTKRTKYSTIPYSDSSKVFPTDYDRMNPVTQKEAMAEWLDDIGAEKPIRRLITKSSREANEKPEEGQLVENIINLVQNNQQLGLDSDKMPKDIPLTSEIKQLAIGPQIDRPLSFINMYRIGHEAQDAQKKLIYDLNIGRLHQNQLRNSMLPNNHAQRPHEALDRYYPTELFGIPNRNMDGVSYGYPITRITQGYDSDNDRPTRFNDTYNDGRNNGNENDNRNMGVNMDQPIHNRDVPLNEYIRPDNDMQFNFPNGAQELGLNQGIYFTPQLYQSNQDGQNNTVRQPDINYYDAYLKDPEWAKKFDKK